MKRGFFLFCILLAAFAINCEYGITRPASNGLLLTYFSASVMPWVWLATVPLNLFVVMLYNRYLSRIGPVKMLGTVALLTIVINGLTPFLMPYLPGWIFFQFAWKDVYILLMFKQLWSLIHSSPIALRAKIFYGFIYATGTLGAVFGSLVPGLFAVELGSAHLFFFTLPVYLFLFWGYKNAVGQLSGEALLPGPKEENRPKEGFAIVRKSPFLLAVLGLVLLMQMAVGLMEFQFNTSLEQNVATLDLRTQYMGRMLSYTNLLSGFLQLIGTGALVHFLGLRKSHLAVPLMLLGGVAGLIAVPSFALVSFAFVFTKAVDFSLFGILREMLYIPLKPEEKFQAKAVIDVFVHRSAKAVVSVCILGLSLIAGKGCLPWISPAAAIVLVAWVGVVWFSLRRHLPVSAAGK